MPGQYLNARTRLKDTLVGSLRSQCIRLCRNRRVKTGTRQARRVGVYYMQRLV